jgi:hypothetical protein
LEETHKENKIISLKVFLSFLICKFDVADEQSNFQLNNKSVGASLHSSSTAIINFQVLICENRHCMIVAQTKL